MNVLCNERDCHERDLSSMWSDMNVVSYECGLL